ncbi:HlyU family transcriptional regulator [Pararhizobium arenae]|uniref:HlyU family transcriptional regulator n=1 Tax=Pararhizobium arenae TaxID=1856850 RepID=UPI00094AA86A|nr:HlyU family transcriptional regulator [Pararhizobium arenae]
MASFFSKLFGLSGGSSEKPAGGGAAKTETYADCLIKALPMREGSQFRLAGSIEKTIDGEVRVRNFIRADLFTSEQDAIDATLRKAHQIIDQNGPSLFSDGAEPRQV